MGASHTSLDHLFEMLAEQRRRYVLYYLDETTDHVVTLDEIATQLCTWERNWDGRTSQSQGKHRENIRVDLHHVHLPQLAETGLIDYDARSQTIRDWSGESLLEAIQENQDECPRLEALFMNAEV